MKYILALTVALLATPASALVVTNLDEVDHQVIFEANPGNKVIRTLSPNQTTRILQPAGRVYLKGREHGAHVNPNDLLVIWKEGNLQIQQRRKGGRSD